ncbi:MAG: M6 family metalloprotease domain-containing protein [Luteolibacter sp.]
MKKSKSLRSSYLLILLAGCLGYANAAPYGREGREINWVQPSGEKLTLHVYGDEYYARTETADGYSVAYDSTDGAYHYAGISADGTKLVPSGPKADQPADASWAKHLNLTPDKIAASSKARHTKFDAEREAIWAERVSAHQALRAAQNGVNLKGADVAAAKANAKAAEVSGDKIGLTVLVQFPNDSNTAGSDPIDFPTTQAKITRFCNGVGYNEDGNTGSVRDFYDDQSGGKLNYTQAVAPIVTMPKARNYYNFSDYPTNKTLRDNSGDLLLTDAITELKKINFDFSKLTLDSSNRAVATNVFFAGPDSGVWAQGLWPYSTGLPSPINVGSSANPIYIYRYQQTNIENSAPVIGTFCHENGHLLMGYPDLYDYGGQSEGVGQHSLMGSGNYNNGGKTPSPIDAHLKDVVGWENVTEISTTDSLQVSLPTTGNVAYRLTKPGTDTEYFLVENRGSGDKWAQYSVDKGIAIWHIDENKDGDDEEQMTSDLHYEVSLEQADNQFDLEKGKNRGDGKDLYDQATSDFSDTTSPNSKWWSGVTSDVKVQVLGALGASTSVHFGSIPPNTIVVGAPNGGEVIYAGSTYAVNWAANISGNVKIELYKAGSPYLVVSANQTNNGTLSWTVPKTVPFRTDYTLKISSISNTIATSDVSDAPFTITNVHFPANNAMPEGWYIPADADVGWKVTKSEAYEGTSSLTSRLLGDGKVAGVAYKSNFKAGNVGFYIKVSSEKGYDYARFYIDGVPKTIVKALGNKGVTGQTGWTYALFPVSAGTHTLKWTYEKDDSYISGDDAAWLDGVSLPATTQEIAVEYPVGKRILDGKGLVTFPDTPLGYTSKSQIITITNIGHAKLSGLKITKSGPQSEEFTVGPLASTKLAAGKSMTFEVKFAPQDLDLREANIKIHSNDADEPAFVISLNGKGRGIPVIGVAQPASMVLKDGKALVKFGYAVVHGPGKRKTFTITNNGSATLKDLEVVVGGTNKGDFTASKPGAVELAPRESTTFTVTFNPSKKNDRTAAIKILSNDTRSGTFNIKLSGIGAPPLVVSSSSGGIAAAVLGTDGLKAAASAPALTSVEVINGQKYLSLTVTKPAGTNSLVRTVEVSSNLLDWYSGENHTTTLLDNDTTLKVRDNTPTTPEAKRYIQLKVTQP